jgi:hypothetical protein
MRPIINTNEPTHLENIVPPTGSIVAANSGLFHLLGLRAALNHLLVYRLLHGVTQAQTMLFPDEILMCSNLEQTASVPVQGHDPAC